jgi:hypothetical protein
MQKLLIKFGISVSTLSALLLAAPALAAPNFISNLSLSNPQALVGEKFTITVNLQNISKIKKAEIKIDDKVLVNCKKGKYKCVATLGKFSEADVGEHTFAIVVTPKVGTVFVSNGKYEVVSDNDKDQVLQIDEEIVNGTNDWLVDWKKKNKFIPAKNDSYPELDGITASTFEPKVGKKYSLTAWAKNKAEILGMGVYVDEEIPDTGIGSNCIMCLKSKYPANSGRLIGPFTKNDIGEHNYGVLIVGKNGKRRVVQGTFEVKP